MGMGTCLQSQHLEAKIGNLYDDEANLDYTGSSSQLRQHRKSRFKNKTNYALLKRIRTFLVTISIAIYLEACQIV